MITFRKIMSLMPDGITKHALRNFNTVPNGHHRAQSVKELAECIGFTVVRTYLPNGVAGQLVQDPFSTNGYCIEVNESHGIKRQRFTVLHEIGHYFLHSDHTDPFAPIKLRERSNHFYLDDELKEEREADEFAAVILFAEGALEASNSIFDGDIEKMAQQFGVSNQVIEIGLRQFVSYKKLR